MQPVGNVDGLKPDDVNPRLVYHYGVPPGAILLSYDSIQKILAISTKDGRIKVFGKDGAQALLESPNIVPSKFMQVWDVDQKSLSNVHEFKRDITSFKIIQHTPYMYIGDSLGYVWVLKLEKEPCNVVKMKYHIPFVASHGNSNEDGDNAIVEILPQPTAESKRVLIIYRDGLIILWAVQESKTIFTTGGNALQSVNHEAKKTTAACWACPNGTKLVVGYSNGEIFIWSIPTASNLKSEQESIKESSFASPNAPICKLNIGYKLDKIPIAKLRWAYADGKASRLYVMGFSDNLMNLSQVVLLNEHTESRTIKLGLHPPESCLDMEIISSSKGPSKQKYDAFLLLGKSGVVYAYDDSLVERYLLQCQTKSPPSLPKEISVKLPFVDSSITIAKLITDNPYMLWSGNQDYNSLTKDIFPLFPFERKQKDGTISNSGSSAEFSKAKNLYITGHSNGAINFWDVSCPLMLPIVSLTQQIRIYKFKTEAFAPDNSFLSFQGSKKGSNQIIRSLKLLKVNGAVLSITMNPNSKSFSVGSDQGYVSLIDIESLSILYERHIATELCTGIISSQFETCSLHGFEKNVLVLATRDSSVLALEGETGNILSPSMVHPKKPSRALFMQIIGVQENSSRGSSISDCMNTDKGNPDASRLPLVLLCSEKAVYVYSLVHVVQGVKKVHYKKKFHSSSCCWASTFDGPQAGVVLLFSNGKVEIRSLPELSLLKETSVRGLTVSTPKANSISDTSICSSHSGELIVVDRDQEMFFISVSVLKDSYRFLDLASQVYDREILVEQGPISAPVIHKEKKKGIFGSVIKGNKAKNPPEQAAEDPQESIEELSAIFSVPNFPLDAENDEKLSMDEDDILDIDDIDIEDPVVKPKGNPMVAALNKQNLTNSFEAIRGKFKSLKVKNDKVQVTESPQDEKAGAVDQIKKKYGYTSSETGAAEAAKSKLSENLRKLQGINLRTAEMQDTARSFSAMAKEVLKFAGNEKGNEKASS
nr:Guanine nucleotide-binding protein, beta subunit [Ipomoea batatas]GMC63937.1 Guanine nucleotide-binding protein, beta subunit [Ipomoea batatas]